MSIKKVINSLIIVSMLLGLTGCSKNVVTENDDPQLVLKNAAELMQKETRRSSVMEKTYYYSDGVSEKETVTVIYDQSKGIRQETTEYEMGFEFTTYNVKEGNDYYVYIQESSDEEQWIRYEEAAKAEDTLYEYYAAGVDFSFTEEMGYYNVQYVNEGKDAVKDTDAIRIKVTADIIYEEFEEEDREITRESVLEENGWTEEEISLVDGFSEILDDYVEANQLIDNSAVKYEQYVWVDAKTNAILKTETNTVLENGDDSGEASLAIEAFENEYWKVAVVHSDIEAGVSPEQAVQNLQEEMAMLEEDGSGESYPTQTKESIIETFVYGSEAEDVGRLPDEYIEMTEEEYYEGLY